MKKGLTSALVGLLACLFLVSLVPAPIARATIDTCSAGAGCWLWWQSSVWNGRYPGNTLEFDFYLYNTYAGTPTDTVSTVQLVTPWGTYSDNTLPQSLCYGCRYSWYANFSIPPTAAPNNYTINFSFTGTYSTGQPFCSSTSNVCTGQVSLDVKANPNTLQAQVTSLQATIASLNANITSLKSQIASLQTQQASLQAQLTTAKGNITSLQAALATTNSQLSTAKTNLTNAQTQLAATQATLASTQASLASTQASLSTESNLYLPLGVAIPSIVAALLAVLYFRKRPPPPP